MNRNLLLIAIAAVAAVGITAGVLFVGNGPLPGPLSGALGPAATTLTLTASTCSAPDGAGNVSFTLSGQLTAGGYMASANVTVAVGNGTQSGLSLTSSHSQGDKTYTVNAAGTITP